MSEPTATIHFMSGTSLAVTCKSNNELDRLRSEWVAIKQDWHELYHQGRDLLIAKGLVTFIEFEYGDGEQE